MVSQVIDDGWAAEEVDRDAGAVPGERLDIGVLVVDDERRVVVVNSALRDLLGSAGVEPVGDMGSGAIWRSCAVWPMAAAPMPSISWSSLRASEVT